MDIEKQFGILLSSFEQQSSRAWVRFNIFIGLQIAIFTGVFTGIELLQNMSCLLNGVFVLNLLLITGFFTMMLRNLNLDKRIFRALLQLEKESEGKIEIIKRLGYYNPTPDILVINGYVKLILVAVIDFFTGYLWCCLTR